MNKLISDSARIAKVYTPLSLGEGSGVRLNND